MNNELHKYISEEAKPNPIATINSFRAFGYDLPKSIADIIDNSISAWAKNVWIDYKWEGKKSWIKIKDDGIGMDKSTLINAMTPGSIDPENERSVNDLGRFGMGLKTASFSQCKSVSVITKTDHTDIIYRTWDLDFVNQAGNWHLLDYLPEEKFINDLDALASGTTVLWFKLDRVFGKVDSENFSAKIEFYKKFEDVENYLRLIFHRFIEKEKIGIYLNNRKIEAWDPFLKGEKGSQVFDQERFEGDVKIKGYILPHPSKLSKEKQNQAEGPYGWLNSQGFYVYRNERLLLYGSWLGLYKKMEHFKLTRIMIDISNRFDSDWKIDIKKSQAYPPNYIIDEIRRIAEYIRNKSKQVYRFRGKEIKHQNSELFNFSPMWRMIKTRQGNIDYKINKKHPLIEKFLQHYSGDKEEFKKLLDFIGESVPIELIIENYNEDPERHDKNDDNSELDKSTIEIAQGIFKYLISNGLAKNNAIAKVLNTEPFDKYTELEKYLKK